MSIVSRYRSAASTRGLTMVELIIFIVIVSIAIAGVLLVMNVTTARSGDAQLRKQALSIAEALLEEVESARFTYCDPQSTNATDPALPTSPNVYSYTNCTVPENVGPETGNTRPYDNVNDYVSKLGVQQSILLQDAYGDAAIAQAGTYVPCITISRSEERRVGKECVP